MPFRRNYRTSNYRRRYNRKVRSGFWKAKQRKYAGKGQTGIRFFKLRKIVTLSSDALGGITLDVNNGPHNSFQDWSSVNTLFDSYKVSAMKVKFIPQLPNDSSTVTGYHPLYVVGDPDSYTTPLTTVNEAIQYENCKTMNMFRPWQYYFRCPKLSGVGSTAAVKTQENGWIDVATPYGHCGIYGYGTGFDTSQQYGTLVCTLYMMCKDRR